MAALGLVEHVAAARALRQHVAAVALDPRFVSGVVVVEDPDLF